MKHEKLQTELIPNGLAFKSFTSWTYLDLVLIDKDVYKRLGFKPSEGRTPGRRRNRRGKGSPEVPLSLNTIKEEGRRPKGNSFDTYSDTDTTT